MLCVNDYSLSGNAFPRCHCVLSTLKTRNKIIHLKIRIVNSNHKNTDYNWIIINYRTQGCGNV